MAVLTTDSSVELFERQMNDLTVKKPIKPTRCIRMSTAIGQTLPLLACNLVSTERLLVMYGSAVCPAFDTLELVRTEGVWCRVWFGLSLLSCMEKIVCIVESILS